MTRYKRCKAAVFDARLGEYKCCLRQCRVSGTNKCVGCRMFERGEPVQSKDNEPEEEDA